MVTIHQLSHQLYLRCGLPWLTLFTAKGLATSELLLKHLINLCRNYLHNKQLPGKCIQLWTSWIWDYFWWKLIKEGKVFTSLVPMLSTYTYILTQCITNKTVLAVFGPCYLQKWFHIHFVGTLNPWGLGQRQKIHTLTWTMIQEVKES